MNKIKLKKEKELNILQEFKNIKELLNYIKNDFFKLNTFVTDDILEDYGFKERKEEKKFHYYKNLNENYALSITILKTDKLYIYNTYENLKIFDRNHIKSYSTIDFFYDNQIKSKNDLSLEDNLKEKEIIATLVINELQQLEKNNIVEFTKTGDIAVTIKKPILSKSEFSLILREIEKEKENNNLENNRIYHQLIKILIIIFNDTIRFSHITWWINSEKNSRYLVMSSNPSKTYDLSTPEKLYDYLISK